MISGLNPVGVALYAAFHDFRGHEARICRVDVHFPDIGKPTIRRVGFLRYLGESSFVAPQATEQELSLPPGLTIHL